jgi:hypothetical protein
VVTTERGRASAGTGLCTSSETTTPSHQDSTPYSDHIHTSPLTRNSGFTDRLDGSFKVVRALDGSGCISLESAAYPDTYLHTTTGNGSNGVAASINPDPTAATWCATDAATPVTGKYLASAADQSRVLTTGTATNRALTTTTTRNAESAWFVDTALAFPGN